MSGQRVGVVGDDRLVEAIDGAVAVPAEETAGVEVIVAVGDDALVDLARANVSTPTLPVDTDAGVRSVPRESVAAAIGRVLESAQPTDRHPVLSVESDDRTVRALLDVALVTGKPARISEYSILQRDERVARVRSDGIAISTPAGSVGYNAAADGPIVALGTDAVSVVPISPFATDPDRWVLPAGAMTLVVERDETPVELLVDGRPEGRATPESPICIRRTGVLETLRVPEGERFF